MPHRAVHLRTAVAECAPAAAQLADLVQIKRVRQDARTFAVGLLDQPAGLVRNEGRAVERQRRGLVLVVRRRRDRLGADAVGCNKRHDVRRRVPLHAAPPVRHGIAVQDRLGADRGRVEQQFRAHQRHAPRGLREPLVPADAHTDFGVCRVPHAETGVAGREIELFLIEMVIRDVGLAVLAEHRTVRVDDGDRVKGRVAHALIIANRQHDPEVARNAAQFLHCRIFLQRSREMVVFVVLFLAEVPVLKQFGQQDDLRALRRRLFHLLYRGFQPVGHLDRGNRHFAHRFVSFIFRLCLMPWGSAG